MYVATVIHGKRGEPARVVAETEPKRLRREAIAAAIAIAEKRGLKGYAVGYEKVAK